jgi:hypothetical protein
MIYLKKYCAIISVIYDIVYFSVPGQVEDLNLTPYSHNISVNWKKPISDSYCVMQYVVYWMNTSSKSNDTSIVSSEEDSFIIEDLVACVEYEVSVSAVNEKDKSTDAVTGKTTTETVGNYHAQIILLYL